ncbi:MAG: ABC transporter ATP-binding protein [Rubricoccaceae bacterium]|nr:ABC transporter ATP-binding protein [Rubricoccaceae bacterium]
MPHAVSTSGLAKTYAGPLGRNAVHALRPLDLAVEEGEIFGLLGPNGAGKTTLVKLLLGLARPTEGEAALFGRSIREPEARRPVGFLPENHRFPPFLTARETLRLYARLAGVPEAERAARASTLLDRVRLVDAADRRVKTFSKGMMQRLGLAQALMSRPRLVFLDEPTDGVDPVGRREIRDLLLELRAGGTTLFLNSHLLSEIERVCTRVAILNEGRLVREGTVEALTTTERLWRLRSTPLPPDLLAGLDGAVTAEPGAEDPSGLARYRLAVPDRPALNALLDRLRTAHVEVEAVEPLRQSLEDLFVEVVQDTGTSTPS